MRRIGSSSITLTRGDQAEPAPTACPVLRFTAPTDLTNRFMLAWTFEETRGVLMAPFAFASRVGIEMTGPLMV